MAGVVGPLIDVPVMVALVDIALWARHRYYPEQATASTQEQEGTP